MAIDRAAAALEFLRTAFEPDDWIAVLLKSHETGGTAQRVGPLSLIAHPRFQAWLRAQSARRFSVYVSVNAIRPQQRARTRDAISKVRHVFLDADRDGDQILASLAARCDLPTPSYVLRSSPSRLHMLWRVAGFTRDRVEALQKQLARDLGTDKAATSCAQVTRLPGFFNHKYRPAPMVVAQYGVMCQPFAPRDFPPVVIQCVEPRVPASNHVLPSGTVGAVERARRYLLAVPPAVSGEHGDVATFRVCCRLVRGFALDDEEAMALLLEWNRSCRPLWSESELRNKLASARRYGREPFGGLLAAR